MLSRIQVSGANKFKGVIIGEALSGKSTLRTLALFNANDGVICTVEMTNKNQKFFNKFLGGDVVEVTAQFLGIVGGQITVRKYGEVETIEHVPGESGMSILAGLPPLALSNLEELSGSLRPNDELSLVGCLGTGKVGGKSNNTYECGLGTVSGIGMKLKQFGVNAPASNLRNGHGPGEIVLVLNAIVNSWKSTSEKSTMQHTLVPRGKIFFIRVTNRNILQFLGVGDPPRLPKRVYAPAVVLEHGLSLVKLDEEKGEGLAEFRAKIEEARTDLLTVLHGASFVATHDLDVDVASYGDCHCFLCRRPGNYCDFCKSMHCIKSKHGIVCLNYGFTMKITDGNGFACKCTISWTALKALLKHCDPSLPALSCGIDTLFDDHVYKAQTLYKMNQVLRRGFDADVLLQGGMYQKSDGSYEASYIFKAKQLGNVRVAMDEDEPSRKRTLAKIGAAQPEAKRVHLSS